MNLRYISPEFPPNFQNFIKRAHEHGLKIFAIGESDYFNVSERVRPYISWYEKINPYNQDQLLYVIHRINDQAKQMTGRGIDIVESHNEHWLRLEAFINSELHLEGVQISEIDLWKKKSLMKRAIIDLGINAAPGRVVKGLDDALDFTEHFGYPIILKPDEGVGATATYKITCEGELRSIFPKLKGEFFIEKFVVGRMVTYDGLTDLDGNIVFDNSLVYGSGVLDNVQGLDTFFYSRREIPLQLEDMGRKIVKRFNLRRKFFHLEFFECGKEIIPLEVNARAPGGPIVDIFNYQTDADMYDNWARIISKEKPITNLRKKYCCAYIGRKDRNYRHSHEEVMHKFGHHVIEFGENPPLFVDGMGRYRYIFRTETEQQLYHIRNYILETWG